jgi:hypothetical protein
MCLFEFLDSKKIRGCLFRLKLDLLDLVLIEYLLLISQYFQCLLRLGIILHDRIITADGPLMNLSEWIADPRRHVIELLQCLIIGPPLDRLWFGVYSQVDDSIGSLAQLLHLLIPVVQ